MTVYVNDKVTKWAGKQDTTIKDNYNLLIGDIANNNDFQHWRHIGKSNNIYDARLSGDLRIVGERSKDKFEVKAVYRHLTGDRKDKVVGSSVAGYAH